MSRHSHTCRRAATTASSAGGDGPGTDASSPGNDAAGRVRSSPGDGVPHRAGSGLGSVVRSLLPPVLCGLLLAAAGTGTLEAQEPGETAPAPDDTVEVEELVVTAHRVPVSRDALTGSVTVIDEEEIRASGADHVLELLRSVPGANVVQSGSYGDVTSLFLRGGESNFVQVLVDGVPLNRAGGDFDFSTLTLDNVERIEIVRGPASVLYGSDAATGVVQIFTRDGEGPPSATASAEAGTHGTLDWRASLSGGTEDVGYGFSLSRFVTDGVHDFNDDYRNVVGSGRVHVTPDERTEASLSLRYSDNETGVPTDFAGNPVDRNAQRPGESLALGAEVGRFLTDRLEARALLTVHDEERGFLDEPDGPADTLGIFASRSQSSFTRQGVDTRLNYHLGEGTVLTAGVEFENQEERATSEFRSQFGTSRTETEAERDNLGYYAQALIQLEELTLDAGVRVDDNDEFGTFETFRAGASYAFPTGTRLRASYGNAFKEPTFVENFGVGSIRGNPDLDPEETQSWEVGLEQRLWRDRVTLSAVFFDQDFQDLIQFTFLPPSPDDPNFFNVAEAESRGLELEAEAELPLGLLVGGSYTYLDTEVTDEGFGGQGTAFLEGGELLRRASHTGDLRLAWRHRDRGSVRISALYVGEREDLDFAAFPAQRVTLDDYVRVDFSARFAVVEARGGRPEVAPTLRIENLFDEDYEEVLGFESRGRTVLAGLRLGISP